jgi:ligand-binding SRPBCC domain-containing protein
VIFERTTTLAAPLAEVFDFFAQPENLARITPPAVGFRVLRAPARPLREGDVLEYRLRAAGLPLRWRSRITLWQPGRAFADLQERGPFAYWLHTHTFSEEGNVVTMHDHVDYRLPFGLLGRLVASALVRRTIAKAFDYRAAALRNRFVTHSR